MKNLFLRSGAALACALSLAACGGGNANLYLSGVVTGLTKPGLVLKNGNSSVTVDGTSAGGTLSFTFPDLLKSDESFDVEPFPPEGTVCTALYNKGKTGAYSISNIQINCHNVPQELSGVIQNLKGSGLVLNNGPTQVKVAAGATTFSFAVKDSAGNITSGAVGQGEPFGVTVLTQPSGQTCTVANGSGVMAKGYSGVIVTCQ
jgi:hypothetical protein